MQAGTANDGEGGGAGERKNSTNDDGNTFSTAEVLACKHEFSGPGGDVELAVTGAAFDVLVESGEDMEVLLLKTRIFARMSPEGKVKAVQMHIEKGLIVGMCGDGGNDCGALRAAHAGIALSEAEASVVSPFTSKTKSIASVVDLLKEGRASLVTSFAGYAQEGRTTMTETQLSTTSHTHTLKHETLTLQSKPFPP